MRIKTAIFCITFSLFILTGFSAYAASDDALTKTDFVYVPSGLFIMGDNKSQKGDDSPEHNVTISKGFFIYSHEVTQQEWFDVMGTKPWLNEDGSPKLYVHEHPSSEQNKYPVTHISWNDVQSFISILNSGLTNNTYRLPTEAEWEYVCRAAGSQHTLFSFGDDPALIDKYGWYIDNAKNVGEQYAHQIKQKKPNAWGLYDMHGNVWEWCYDYHDNYYYELGDITDPTGPVTGDCKVIRGGAINESGYSKIADDCTCANRTCRPPTQSTVGYDLGFRLVKESKVVVDSDGDGIHDDWERIIFGNLTTANATSDFDKDGYSDKQEYLNKDLKDSKGDFFTPVLWKNAPDGSGYNSATRKAPGDIDENKAVNSEDVATAFKFFLGTLAYTPQQFAAANVYNDRDAHITITINDVHGVSALAGN